MAPRVYSRPWIKAYAERCAILKGHGSGSKEATQVATTAITRSFKTVYRAVALDIDGTLTSEHGEDVDIEMAHVVGYLLQRGVPVILISGRGRPTARKAAEQIRQAEGLSSWYLRRLLCITHNGVFLLRTPLESPTVFLSDVKPLVEGDIDVERIAAEVEQIIDGHSPHLDHAPIVSREPKSVRIVFQCAPDRERIEVALQEFVAAQALKGTVFHLTRGSYGNYSCLDLATTNKQIALEQVASSIGVPQDRILRIGDQGQEGGNDFDLLDSAAGFSVEHLSTNVSHCHPVLNENLETQLYGAEATNRLLNLVRLFAPLSITPDRAFEQRRALRAFERIAVARSKVETDSVTQRLRYRLRFLLLEDGLVNAQDIQISDIYDLQTGGVKFRDWELDDIASDHPALELFGIANLDSRESGVPYLKWALFTDTGILMRGPNYYFGRTRPPSERTFSTFVGIASNFIKHAEIVIDRLSTEEADFVRYKFALAIFDNVRNILLQSLFATFVAEAGSGSRSYRFSRRLYENALFPHTLEHYRFLLDPDFDWLPSLEDYRLLLRVIHDDLVDWVEELRNSLGDRILSTEMPTWRECDHFLQNITAVQLGLLGILRNRKLRDMPLLSVGLSYGGTELPVIAQVIADGRSTMHAGLADVSIHRDKDVSKLILEGKFEQVTDLLLKRRHFCVLSSASQHIEGSKCILLDDNCTTGITMQLARDYLLLQGADVVGTIIVRFPGANRHLHMARSNSGFVDPELLLSFVRGLVAPSPYSRLLSEDKPTDSFLDSTGVFDKAKTRIDRYLKKNGTPAIKSEKGTDSAE